MKRIGLIAGWGRFPIVVAQSLKEQGYHVACVALKDHADPVLENICDQLRWTSVAKVGHAIRFCKRCGASQAILAGKVFKLRLFQPGAIFKLMPDWRTVRIFWSHFIFTRSDRKDDTLLTAIVTAFAQDGVEIRPASDFVPELLVKFGQLTRLGPTKAQLKDIEFGWTLAKEMGRLDIGQSVVVKDRACLAVEAIEGTDECIRRAGTLCPAGGFTVVKLAKPQQDMRFDVPTIGVGTLETMKATGAKLLVVEAGKTILVDQRECIELANREQIVVVALESAVSGSDISGNQAA